MVGECIVSWRRACTAWCCTTIMICPRWFLNIQARSFNSQLFGMRVTTIIHLSVTNSKHKLMYSITLFHYDDIQFLLRWCDKIIMKLHHVIRHDTTFLVTKVQQNRPSLKFQKRQWCYSTKWEYVSTLHATPKVFWYQLLLLILPISQKM